MLWGLGSVFDERLWPLMTATLVDLEHWPRRDTLALFRRFQKPQFAVTSRVDVTAVLSRRKKDKTFSAYLACMHAVGTALHAVPELAYRIKGEGVVVHDRMILSPTLLFPDGRLGFTYLDWLEDAETFAAGARAAIDATLAVGRMEPGIDRDEGVAFLSCQPWLDFTAFDNPVLNPEDSIPRITWGMFTAEPSDRWSMAVALQVHHGLVDGLHVAQFFLALQKALDAV